MCAERHVRLGRSAHTPGRPTRPAPHRPTQPPFRRPPRGRQTTGPEDGASRACKARITCSRVTTPRRRPSASTAISAPRRRSGSDASSASSGASVGHLALGAARGGHVAHGHRAALLQRGVLDRRPVREPDELPVALDHGEPVPALVAPEVVVVGLQGRDAGGDRHRLGVHDVGDRHALEPLGHRALRHGAARGAAEQPAEHDRPQAAGDVVAHQHARRRSRSSATRGPRPCRAANFVAFTRSPVMLPGGGARDPAAVEREGRQQVEHEQDRVHRHQEGDEQRRERGRRDGVERRGVDEVAPALQCDAEPPPAPARPAGSRPGRPRRRGTRRPASSCRGSSSSRRRTGRGRCRSPRCPRAGRPCACPSSCSSSVPKNSSVAATAATKPSVSSSSWSPNGSASQ